MLGDELAELIRMGARESAIRAYAKSLTAQVLTEDERRLADETEACIECMFLMAGADGQIANDERLMLSASVRAMLEPYESGSDAELALPLLKLNERLDRFATELEVCGLEQRIAAVAARLQSQEARCFAFCLVAAVAFVDDFVASGEASAIERFASALGLGPDESQYLMREVHDRLGAK